MKRVTIRVPATTANLGPGFDAFGCALSLYTDVTFEETEWGLEITGCPEEFTLMERLEELSGVPTPKNLATLKGKPERHTGVIHKEEMLDFVLGL